MRKILCLICTCIGIIGVAIADTININWLNEDYTRYDTTTCTVGGNLSLPTAPTKRGYTFTGWERSFVPIEYIESTGTQYIELDRISKSDTIEIKFAWNAAGGQFIFGAWQFFYFGFYNSKYFWYYNGENSYSNTAVPPTMEQTIIFNDQNGNIVQNDVIKASVGTQASNKGNIRLFCRLRNGGCEMSSRAKVYYFKVRNKLTNKLVLDLIPAIDLDGVVCMYDKVSGTFFYNAGTGNFIAGPAI